VLCGGYYVVGCATGSPSTGAGISRGFGVQSGVMVTVIERSRDGQIRWPAWDDLTSRLGF
jgi:hypothetical protein